MKFADINEQFRRFRHAVRAFSSMTRAGLANQNDAMIRGLQAEQERADAESEIHRLGLRIQEIEAQITGLRDAVTRPNPCREVSHTRRSAMMQGPIESPMHLNPSDHLPVVGALLWIEVEPGKLVKATRTGFIPSKKSQMGYELSDGIVLTGRYRWAYQ